MINKIEIEKINILNVNNGLLKCDEQGFYVEIPVYPKYKNKKNISILESKNAPEIFLNSLINPGEESNVKYHIERIADSEVKMTKEKAIETMEINGFDVLIPDLYNYLKSNSLKETVKLMTDNDSQEYPFFIESKEF